MWVQLVIRMRGSFVRESKVKWDIIDRKTKNRISNSGYRKYDKKIRPKLLIADRGSMIEN